MSHLFFDLMVNMKHHGYFIYNTDIMKIFKITNFNIKFLIYQQ